MAGLLDPTDAALMALGTGLLGGGTFAQAFGRGGQGFLSTYAAAQQAQQEKALKERELAMHEQLQKAQIANYESEAAQRTAALEMDRKLMSLFGGAPSTAATAPPVDGVGPMPSIQPLQLGAPQSSTPTSGGIISQMTPEQLAMFKFRGKDMTDIYKLTQPDWQVSNGFRWNKNAPDNTTGFVPSVSTSANGQTTALVPDGKGGLMAVVPQGAGDVYSDFQDREQRAKAKYDLVTVTGPDGKSRQMTRADAIAMAGGGSPSQNIGGAITPELRALIEADAMREGVANPKINLTSPGVGNMWDMSGAPRQPGMQVQSEADKKREQTRIEIDAEAEKYGNKAILDSLKESKTKAEAAASNLSSINRMLEAVDSNKLMAGPGTKYAQVGLQIANLMGVQGKNSNEQLANTRVAIQSFAQMALDAAPALQGQGQITEGERALLTRAKSGNLDDLTIPEIRALMGVYQRASLAQIKSHAASVQKARGIRGFENFLPTVEVATPKIYEKKMSDDDLLKMYLPGSK